MFPQLLPLYLVGLDKDRAIKTIKLNHYTRSVPSGKSYYIRFEDAIICWSIPANKNIGRFLLGCECSVWELARLWAPDGHRKNLLTQAISYAVKVINKLESPDILVSYADPNANHQGFVYRAASWLYHGDSDETRMYVGADGRYVARRSFHSGNRGMTKAQIESLGFTEIKLQGKIRFVKPLSKMAKRKLL